MGLTCKTLYGRITYHKKWGSDVKKICSVIILSFFVLLLLVSCEKSSSDWVTYKYDNEGNVSSYMKGNVQKDDGNYIVQVSVKVIYSDKGREKFIQTMTENGISTKEYDKLSDRIYLKEIDCKNQKMKILSINNYDTNGKVFGSRNYPEGEWEHIAPDSHRDALRKNVCE
jgi:hypothetical protein